MDLFDYTLSFTVNSEPHIVNFGQHIVLANIIKTIKLPDLISNRAQLRYRYIHLRRIRSYIQKPALAVSLFYICGNVIIPFMKVIFSMMIYVID